MVVANYNLNVTIVENEIPVVLMSGGSSINWTAEFTIILAPTNENG